MTSGEGRALIHKSLLKKTTNYTASLTTESISNAQ